MTEYCVTVLWITRCNLCKHKHTRKELTYGPEIKYTTLRPPRECDNCKRQLRGDKHTWSRTFEITDVYEI